MAWPPRSGFEAFEGCVWLPRFIDKTRKSLSQSAAPGELLEGGYLFGENDYLDAQLLAFLGLSAQRIVDHVAADSDDAGAGRKVLSAAGKSQADCAGWSLEFVKRNSIFLNMIDADEGRLQPAEVSDFLRNFYNSAIVGPATEAYIAKQPNRN